MILRVDAGALLLCVACFCHQLFEPGQAPEAPVAAPTLTTDDVDSLRAGPAPRRAEVLKAFAVEYRHTTIDAGYALHPMLLGMGREQGIEVGTVLYGGDPNDADVAVVVRVYRKTCRAVAKRQTVLQDNVFDYEDARRDPIAPGWSFAVADRPPVSEAVVQMYAGTGPWVPMEPPN